MPKREYAPVSGQASEASKITSSVEMVFPKPHTVKGRILGSFIAGDRLTQHDCTRRFFSSRLGAHVYILKKKHGFPIEEVDEVVTTQDAGRKATIGVYFIPHEIIEQLGEKGREFAEETARINAERRAA